MPDEEGWTTTRADAFYIYEQLSNSLGPSMRPTSLPDDGLAPQSHRVPPNVERNYCLAAIGTWPTDIFQPV
eukprot:scaffold3607_cov71-Cylindrotheca_fusiformis.AAC.1